MSPPDAAPLDPRTLPVALVQVVDGAIAVQNGAAAALLGDATGRPLADVVRPEDRAGLAAWLEGDGDGPCPVRVGEPPCSVVELRRASDGWLCVVDRTDLARLVEALRALDLTVWGVDAESRTVWRPPGNDERTGISDERAAGQFTFDWIHPEDLGEILGLAQRLLAEPGQLHTTTVRALRPDEATWFTARGLAVNHLDHPILGAIVIASMGEPSIELSPATLSESGEFLSLAAIAPVGILLTDRTGELLYANRLAAELFGHGEPGAPRALVARDPYVAALLHRVVRTDRAATELVGREQDGTTRWLRIAALPRHDHEARVLGAVATVSDVTAETEARSELQEVQNRLWHLANHDQLTGLPNRTLFMDRLEQALTRHRRDGHGVALLYCDLDGFREVNAAVGHGLGDRVLVTVAERLRAAVRDTDTVCRVAGDEFLVLCESFTGPDELGVLADRLIAAVAAPVPTELVAPDGTVPNPGLTIGIAVAGPTGSAGALVTAADRAMAEAKAQGKARWSFAPRA